MNARALHRLVPSGWTRRAQRLRRLLGRRVLLQREGFDMRFVLEPAAAPARPAGRGAKSPISATDLAWMLDDLGELLDRHPSARSVFPALVLVERALNRRRGPALERLPAPLRRDAIDLLDRLDAAGLQPGLILLRARLQALEPVPRSSRAGPAMQVEEASLTAFMEADSAWDRQLQQAAATAPEALHAVAPTLPAAARR